MRLNRGIIILGLAATVVTVASVYFTLILDALLCFDSCLTVGATMQAEGFSAIRLLFPQLFLLPALILIVVVWLWELRETRRLGGRGLAAAIAWLPLLALIAIVAVAFLTSLTPQGLRMYPINIGFGTFALAGWPLLVALIAAFWRPAAPPVPAPPATPETSAT
ncbi:MAG TPA: hypothetical protein VF725_11245 [Ktedonobacterales bacterium]